jgi:glycerol-3-phosphate dehydrogenase
VRRDLTALTVRTFDLVVIGGGIFGACASWNAVLRGLSMALIERADFGGATSANSLAGSMAISRGCANPAPRRALLRIAPHLVQPLSIAIPTYRHGCTARRCWPPAPAPTIC